MSTCTTCNHRVFFLADEQEIEIILFRFHYTISHRPYVLEYLSKKPLVLARQTIGPPTRA